MTVTEDRATQVDFSDSYYTGVQVIIVTDDSDITEPDDLKGKKIGVQQGTTGQYYVEGSEDWDFPGLPAKCVTYKSGSLAVQDMLNGNIQYVIIDAAPAAAITDAINAVQ